MATTWKVIKDNDHGHRCNYNLQLAFGTPLAADDKRTLIDGNLMLILKPWLYPQHNFSTLRTDTYL